VPGDEGAENAAVERAEDGRAGEAGEDLPVELDGEDPARGGDASPGVPEGPELLGAEEQDLVPLDVGPPADPEPALPRLLEDDEVGRDLAGVGLEMRRGVEGPLGDELVSEKGAPVERGVGGLAAGETGEEEG
jgi:hypothetical protein